MFTGPRPTLITLAGLALGASASFSHAAPTLQLVDSSYPYDITDTSPGAILHLTLRLVSDVPFLGFSAYLKDVDYFSSAPVAFTITGRQRLAGNPFADIDAITANTSLLPNPVSAGSPDLGYAVGTGVISPGTYDLCMLDIALPTTIQAGMHEMMFTAPSALVGSAYDEIGFQLPPVSYRAFVTLTVPEPASSLVGGAFMLALLRRRHRH